MENENAIQVAQPRLPFMQAIKDKFGIDKGEWRVLVDAIYPNAQTSEAVALALSYCKANKLDVFKKCVHIVPIWDKNKRKNVETIWPGIGLLRTIASRNKNYAGRDATVFGEMSEGSWEDFKWENKKKVKTDDVHVKYPYSAQVTVYKIVMGVRCAFVGPEVYWEEIFASKSSGAPNAMWVKRPKGQLDKCAEAAALRAAFPEELGDEVCSDEGPMIHQHGIQEQHVNTFTETQEAAETEIDKKAGSETVATFEEEKKTEPAAAAKPAATQGQGAAKTASKVTKPAFMED